MQTFNQLFFKKKQIFSYFFKEISEKNKGPDGWSGPFGFFIRVLVLILKLRC